MNLKTQLFRFVTIIVVSCVFFIGISQIPWNQAKANNKPLVADSSNLITSTALKNTIFPLENFQSYTSPFGYRRSPITGEIQFHNGLDMAAPLGTYVVNWQNGKVAKVAQDNACGTHVIVKSGNWKHVYCHLKGYVDTNGNNPVMIDNEGGIQLAQGQTVSTGTRIGRIGMTGRTTGPHLHWVLIKNGSYIDPAVVIREMFGQNASLDSKAENIS